MKSNILPERELDLVADFALAVCSADKSAVLSGWVLLQFEFLSIRGWSAQVWVVVGRTFLRVVVAHVAFVAHLSNFNFNLGEWEF